MRFFCQGMERGLRSPTSYIGSQVFMLGISWYQAILIFWENYYPTIQTFPEFTPTKTNNFENFQRTMENSYIPELLPSSMYFSEFI